VFGFGFREVGRGKVVFVMNGQDVEEISDFMHMNRFSMNQFIFFSEIWVNRFITKKIYAQGFKI
jgi:hypothetical protein